MPARAVVTGGAGFIGSHVVDRLVEDGTRVVVVDDLSTGRRENLEAAGLTAGSQLHQRDVRNVAAMRELLGAERPDVVVHLAARASVTRSVEDPEEDADVNVGGTVALLEAARRASVPRFVYVSTG